MRSEGSSRNETHDTQHTAVLPADDGALAEHVLVGPARASDPVRDNHKLADDALDDAELARALAVGNAHKRQRGRGRRRRQLVGRLEEVGVEVGL